MNKNNHHPSSTSSQPSSASISDKNTTCTFKKNKTNKDILLSKALSWVLRHGAQKIGLLVSSDGYVPIPILLKSQVRNLNSYSVDDIIRVVETNEKQRFHLCMKRIVWKDGMKKSKYSFFVSRNKFYDNGDEENNYDSVENSSLDDTEEVLCIRANQGHSMSGINCEELLTFLTSQELANMSTIIHGTNKNAWEEHIRQEGLSKMNRNHIHFASGLPGDDGIISGMRKNSQVYIYIDNNACARDGIVFYRSANGVILCPGLENGILPVRYFAKVVDANTNESLL